MSQKEGGAPSPSPPFDISKLTTGPRPKLVLWTLKNHRILFAILLREMPEIATPRRVLATWEKASSDFATATGMSVSTTTLRSHVQRLWKDFEAYSLLSDSEDTEANREVLELFRPYRDAVVAARATALLPVPMPVAAQVEEEAEEEKPLPGTGLKRPRTPETKDERPPKVQRLVLEAEAEEAASATPSPPRLARTHPLLPEVAQSAHQAAQSVQHIVALLKRIEATEPQQTLSASPDLPSSLPF